MLRDNALRCWGRSRAAMHTGLLLGGLVFPVISAAANPAVCSHLLGTPAEIAMTPRSDENLEMLALQLSDGIVANEAIYQRLVREIGAMRAIEPKLKGITYLRPHDGRDVILMLDEEADRQFQSGQYHAWDCLNHYYGATRTYPLGRATAVVQLKGLYNTRRLGELYSSLPGVKVAEPNLTTTTGRFTTIYVTPDGETWHYVFDATLPPKDDREAAAYYFVAKSGKTPRFAGKWIRPPASARAMEAPEWMKTYAWETENRWLERAYRESEYARRQRPPLER